MKTSTKLIIGGASAICAYELFAAISNKNCGTDFAYLPTQLTPSNVESSLALLGGFTALSCGGVLLGSISDTPKLEDYV